MLQHHRGQMVGGVTRDVVEADAVGHTEAHTTMRGTQTGGVGRVREVGCLKLIAFLSAGADKQANRGGSALEVGDLLRLLEDGGERGGALVSDLVPSETVSEGRSGNDGRASVSTGADMEANTWGAAANLSEVTALPLSPSHSLVMPSVV